MLNKAILIGKLGFDPEIKYFDNGNIMCILKIVTTNNYKNKNDEKSLNNDWHRIILYKNLADFSKNFLNKGDIVFIEGKIKTRRWLEGGKKYNYITEIIANEVKLIKNYNKKTNHKNYSSLNDIQSENKNFNKKNNKDKNNYKTENNETEFFNSSESNIFNKTSKNEENDKISDKEFLNSNENEVDFDDLESEG